SVTEAASGGTSADAEIIVDPEGDAAAEVARGEDAEVAAGEVRTGNELAGGAGGIQRVEVISVRAGELEERIKAKPDGRHTWYRSGPDGFWEVLFERFRA